MNKWFKVMVCFFIAFMVSFVCFSTMAINKSICLDGANKNDGAAITQTPLIKEIPCDVIYYIDCNIIKDDNVIMAPVPSSVKTYMDYRCITDTTSVQWELIKNGLVVEEDGFLRDDEGFIAVALGSYFGPIGSRWVFQLDTDKEIKAIKADEKQDIHTKDAQHMYGLNGDIIEFVIYADVMPMCDNGYVYWGNFNNVDAFNGKVVSWYRVD